MSIVNVIAAAQQGLAFQNLARRFHADEDRIAIAIAGLVPEILACLVHALDTRQAASDFLMRLSRDHYDSKYNDVTLLTDFTVRDEGIAFLAEITRVRDIDAQSLVRTASQSGLRTSDLERLLPFVAVLTISAIRLRCERPMRDLLAEATGNANWAARQAEPYGPLADHLSGQKAPGLVNGLFGSLRATFDLRRKAPEQEASGSEPSPMRGGIAEVMGNPDSTSPQQSDAGARSVLRPR